MRFWKSKTINFLRNNKLTAMAALIFVFIFGIVIARTGDSDFFNNSIDSDPCYGQSCIAEDVIKIKGNLETKNIDITPDNDIDEVGDETINKIKKDVIIPTGFVGIGISPQRVLDVFSPNTINIKGILREAAPIFNLGGATMTLKTKIGNFGADVYGNWRDDYSTFTAVIGNSAIKALNSNQTPIPQPCQESSWWDVFNSRGDGMIGTDVGYARDLNNKVYVLPFFNTNSMSSVMDLLEYTCGENEIKSCLDFTCFKGVPGDGGHICNAYADNYNFSDAKMYFRDVTCKKETRAYWE